MNAAMITMNSANMMVWFTPSMISGNAIGVARAAGISTLRSIWSRVQPAIRPASTISGEMSRRPRIVSRAIGGIANRMVAVVPALWLTPINTATGIGLPGVASRRVRVSSAR